MLYNTLLKREGYWTRLFIKYQVTWKVLPQCWILSILLSTGGKKPPNNIECVINQNQPCCFYLKWQSCGGYITEARQMVYIKSKNLTPGHSGLYPQALNLNSCKDSEQWRYWYWRGGMVRATYTDCQSFQLCWWNAGLCVFVPEKWSK